VLSVNATPLVQRVDVTPFVVPTVSPESDGTFEWDKTTLVLVQAQGTHGLGYELPYFRRMLDAGAVDMLQADATRCGGITGFVRVAALCEAAGIPLSAHTAPSLHAHVCCALAPAIHVEYFFDHARIEDMLFDGVLTPRSGALEPDRSRPGFGLELKPAEAARYAA
jgi:L-alanine-DL-glutamate epimerase-like enolase superfamily enzyme